MARETRLLVLAERAASSAVLAELAHRGPYRLVGRASSMSALAEAVGERAPDVVIVELSSLERAAALAELVKTSEQLRVVVVSHLPPEVALLPSMAAGALGFVRVPVEIDLLHHAVAAAATGGTYVDPRDVGWLVEFALFGHGARPTSGLTLRQSQVLQLVRAGLTNRQIARTLGLSITTVKSHLNDVMHRLGVQNRQEAAAWSDLGRGSHALEGAPRPPSSKNEEGKLQPADRDDVAHDPKLDTSALHRSRRGPMPRTATANDRTPRRTTTEEL